MSSQDNVGSPAGAALDSAGSHQRMNGSGGFISSVNAFSIGMPSQSQRRQCLLPMQLRLRFICKVARPRSPVRSVGRQKLAVTCSGPADNVSRMGVKTSVWTESWRQESQQDSTRRRPGMARGRYGAMTQRLSRHCASFRKTSRVLPKPLSCPTTPGFLRQLHQHTFAHCLTSLHQPGHQ